MLDEWIRGSEALAREHSPLRVRSDEPMPLEVPTDQLERVTKSLATVCEGLADRIAVVVMGEVKAGKSTLVNALAGAEVSPCNVLEATATIIEIEHASREEVEILRHDGEVIAGTLSSIHDLLDRHVGDPDFFAACRCVRARLPLPRLRRLRLVDTPGLNTVTAANAKVALDYVQGADVVLWVSSALHLGQSDVIESLAEVARLGKPIVLAINRIDQVDSAPERIVRHARRELGTYALEVFPICATRALAAELAPDRFNEETTGVEDLVSFLEAKIQAQSAAVKRESAGASVAALLRVDGAIHQSVLSEVEFLRRQLGRHEHEVMLHAEQIGQRLKEWLRERVETELLANVFAQSRKLTVEIVEREFTLDSIEKWWHGVQEDLSVRFAAEWETPERQFIEEMRAELGVLGRGVRFDPVPARNLVGEGIEGMLDGAKVGALSLLGLSAYVASLSPAISVLGAATLLAPWAIVPAVLGGAALKMAFGRADAERLEMTIRARQRDLQDEFVARVLKPEVFPALERQCQATAAELHRAFERALCGGAGSSDRLADLERSLRAYLHELDLVLAEGAASAAVEA